MGLYKIKYRLLPVFSHLEPLAVTDPRFFISTALSFPELSSQNEVKEPPDSESPIGMGWGVSGK